MASGLDVAARAKAEQAETNGLCGNNNKYTHWYANNVNKALGYNFYWCAAFVSYVVRMCGVPTSVVPNYSLCSDGLKWAKEAGRAYSKKKVIEGKYIPKPGDIFFRDGHTGLIISVSGQKFTTVEGNTGGKAGARTVGSHTFSFSSEYYEYIFNPDYPDKIPDGSETVSSYLKPMYEKVINVPEGLGKYYTFMRWDAITNMDTTQGRLIKEAGKNYNSDGYGIVGNRITLAMTSTFGKIGDYVDVYMEDGTVHHGILADEKSQIITPWDKFPANKWGHNDGMCIVEFVTNWSSSHKNPQSNGNVIKVVNLGSYFDYPEYAGGSATGYMYSENSYRDEESEKTVVWNNRTAEAICPMLENLPAVFPTGDFTVYVGETDVTSYIGNISWSESTSELAVKVNFDVPKTDTKYICNNIYIPKLGDVTRLCANTEFFRGVIISLDDGDKHTNKYVAVDIGWYLNKTKQTYQFKNVTASTAIKRICSDLSISISILPELNAVINKIYFDSCISDIFKDILSCCGNEYNFSFVPEGLRIYKIGDIETSPVFTAASNLPSVSSVDLRGSVNHSLSLENMYNSVKVTCEKDNVYKELTVLQNRDDISRYGFMQLTVAIDPEKENARDVAAKNLSGVSENYSFEIIEDLRSMSRAGDVITIDGVRFVVDEATHSMKNGRHFNMLGVTKII